METTEQQLQLLKSGYIECYDILREHGKTFYVMAKLLGSTRGKGIAALYGFARTADDTVDQADENVSKDQIQSELNEMRFLFDHACAQGDSGVLSNKQKQVYARYQALAETISKYSIEKYPFEDLLLGVEMDLTKIRYQNYKELELYCYRVAGTIGLMVTPVAGFQKNSKALEYAKTLGTAFQLTNILRDVGEDLSRGRIYLPQEDLARFGISETDLINKRNDAAFKKMMDYQIDRAFRIYQEGLALIPLVTTRGGRLAFQFAVDAYSSILHKIRENDYDVYSKRAHLTLWEKLKIIPISWQRSRRKL